MSTQLPMLTLTWTRIEMRYGDVWSVRGRECEITLEPRPAYCDRGNWVAKIFAEGPLAMELDYADGWPRYYFDLNRAKLEIEAWLVKRKQDVWP